MLGLIYAKLRYSLLLIKLLAMLINRLRKQEPFQKTNLQSLAKYEDYGDSEQVDYETRQQIMFFQGRFRRMSFKEARGHYLRHLYRQIDDWIAAHPGQKLNILEVGCGNCINLVNLHKDYGDALRLTGADISPRRIVIARDYYGTALEGTELVVGSITEGLPFPDNAFEIVFTMHCIEQIAYETRLAVCEMYRIARERLVLIEPVFENGNMVQKLYLILSDHCRILFRTLTEQKWNISENRPLDIQSNPANQSSLLVVKKTHE